MSLDEQDIQQIKSIVQEVIVEATKAPVPLCGRPVLQDTSCKLIYTHKGLCKDGDGIWRCPWCLNDAFVGHDKDCPAKDITE